jgi:hypothetical protein
LNIFYLGESLEDLLPYPRTLSLEIHAHSLPVTALCTDNMYNAFIVNNYKGSFVIYIIYLKCLAYNIIKIKKETLGNICVQVEVIVYLGYLIFTLVFYPILYL